MRQWYAFILSFPGAERLASLRLYVRHLNSTYGGFDGVKFKLRSQGESTWVIEAEAEEGVSEAMLARAAKLKENFETFHLGINWYIHDQQMRKIGRAK